MRKEIICLTVVIISFCGCINNESSVSRDNSIEKISLDYCIVISPKNNSSFELIIPVPINGFDNTNLALNNFSFKLSGNFTYSIIISNKNLVNNNFSMLIKGSGICLLKIQDNDISKDITKYYPGLSLFENPKITSNYTYNGTKYLYWIFCNAINNSLTLNLIYSSNVYYSHSKDGGPWIKHQINTTLINGWNKYDYYSYPKGLDNLTVYQQNTSFM